MTTPKQRPLTRLSDEDLRDHQYFTPEWAALELVDRHFSDLTFRDLVIEPSAGLGAFLKAIPESVPAIGVEIDPHLAEQCARYTGREIITGDFSMVKLPAGITAIVGNPPFHVPTIERFMTRASLVLPKGGRCGMILPAYAMQTHQRVWRWLDHFSILSEIIPRRLFPRLRLPLAFVVFTRDDHRTMVGLALYQQAVEVDGLARSARELLENGLPRRGVWLALVGSTLTTLGGEADLASIYAHIESRRPTTNAWWKEKVRQVLQLHFEPVARGRWRLA